MGDPNDKVTVVRPDGSTLNVSRDEAATLEGIGQSQQSAGAGHEQDVADATEDYYTTPGQRAKTLLEGGASGISLGLTDIATEGLGWDSSERAAYNPGTRIAGEIIGGVGAAFIAPQSLLGKAVAATPAGMLSKAARLGGEAVSSSKVVRGVVGGVIEGGGLGAGAALTTAQLNGDPLGAEAIIAGMGWGAVWGGGIGGVAAKAGVIAEGAAAKRMAETAAGKGEIIAAERYGAFRSSIEDARKVSRESVEAAEATVARRLPKSADDFADETITTVNARDIEARGFSSAPGTGDDVVKMEKARKAIAEGQQQPIKINVSPGGVFDIEDGRHRLAAAIEQNAPITVKWQRGNEALDGERLFNATTAREAAQKQLVNDVTMGGKLAAKGAREAKEDVIKTLRKAMVAASDGNAAKFEALMVEHSDKMGTLAKLTGVAAPEVEQFVLKAAQVAEGGMAEVKALRDVDNALKNIPLTADGFAATTSSKMAKHVEAVETLMKTGGAEMEGVRNAVKTAIGEMAESAGLKLEGNPAAQLQGLWEVSRSAKKASKNAGQSGGIVDRVVNSIAGGAGSDALSGGGKIGRMVGYAAGSMVSGLLGLKGAVVGTLADSVGKWAPKAIKGAQRASIPARIDPLRTRLDGTHDESKATRKELMAARADEIRKAGPTIRDTLYRSLATLSGDHPEFASAAHETASKQFEALALRLPRDPGTAFARMKSIWVPDAVATERFARYYEVFHNPVAVVKRALETGNVSTEAATALREVNPELFQHLRLGMLERLSEPGNLEKLTYGDQVTLGRLLDLTIHSTSSPRFIAAQQAMYAQRTEPQPARPRMSSSNNPSGGRPGGTAAQNITEH